jgi:phenylpropionate dioxygenase-like ring-hydroxylating dioxygenase large terminal subunit
MDPAGQFRITRAPLLGDAVSYTMSGSPAVRWRLSDDVATDQIGTLMLFHYPTTWNHVLADHAVTFRMLPLSATETALTRKGSRPSPDLEEAREHQAGPALRRARARRLRSPSRTSGPLRRTRAATLCVRPAPRTHKPLANFASAVWRDLPLYLSGAAADEWPSPRRPCRSGA